jgi:hypothetical protein
VYNDNVLELLLDFEGYLPLLIPLPVLLLDFTLIESGLLHDLYGLELLLVVELGELLHLHEV